MDTSRTADTILINTSNMPVLKEDFKIAIYLKGKIICSFWLNSVFLSIINNNVITLKKQDIDHAFHDKDFSADFAIALTFVKEE